jgi:hypothetical protein
MASVTIGREVASARRNESSTWERSLNSGRTSVAVISMRAHTGRKGGVRYIAPAIFPQLAKLGFARRVDVGVRAAHG